MLLGLDPANACGWCLIDTQAKVTESGCWYLKKASDKQPGQRLKRLRAYILDLNAKHQLRSIAYENAVMGSDFFKVQQAHGEVRGIILWIAAELEIEAMPVNPMTVKKWLTGSGKAQKQDMIAAVKRRFGIETTNDNEADAIAIAQYAAYEIQRKQIEDSQPVLFGKGKK